MAKFIMQLVMDSSLCLGVGLDTFPYGATSQMKDSLWSLGIAKDLPPVMKEPIELNNDRGQLSKVGSWSGSNDQLPLGMVVIDPEAKKN